MEAKLNDLQALCLTSADGFTLFAATHQDFKLEEDKLSAVTSSLTALSQAASKQILHAKFSSTCIETEMGLLFMVHTNYQGKDCILSLISGEHPNLGQIRFYTFKLAKFLTTASLSAENDS